MPSTAFHQWSGVRSRTLDAIENAHRFVGGTGAGRRTATQQINQGYAVLLSGQFQAYCRALHTECASHLVLPVTDLNLRSLYRSSLLLNRKLDRGNPNSGNLGSDFGRFGLIFWQRVDAHHGHNPRRRDLLEELNEWRNAIAHQDFAPGLLRSGRVALQLTQLQTWRKSCTALARSFDEVMRTHLQTMTGVTPW